MHRAIVLIAVLVVGGCGEEAVTSSVADSPWVGLYVSTPQEFDRFWSEREIQRRIDADGLTRQEATVLVMRKPPRPGPWILLHLRADGTYFIARTSDVPAKAFPQMVEAFEGAWRARATEVLLQLSDGSETAVSVRDNGLVLEVSGLSLVLRRTRLDGPSEDELPEGALRYWEQRYRGAARIDEDAPQSASEAGAMRDLRNLLGWMSSLEADGVDVQGISADMSGYWRFECELQEKHDTEPGLLKEWRSRLTGTHVRLLWVRVGRNRSAAAPVTALFRLRPYPPLPEDELPLVSSRTRQVVSIAAMKAAVQLETRAGEASSQGVLERGVVGTGSADSAFKLLYNVAARTLWVRGRFERFEWIRGAGGTEPAVGTCILLGVPLSPR